MTAQDRAQVATWLTGDAATSLPEEVAALSARIELTRREGVSALMCERWRAALDPGDDRVSPLVAEIGRQAALELVRSDAEQRVMAVLADAGIRVLVLKGGALARWLYSRAYHRPRGDFDLMFAASADSDRAETALAAIGYRWDGVLSNEPGVERTVVGTHRGVAHALDLHWALTPHPAYRDRFAFAELWRDRVPLAGLAQGFGLGPVHALVHAALHRLANRWSAEEDRVIWLYDIHLLAGRLNRGDWSALTACARDHGVAAPVVDALGRSAEWLGTSVPADVMTALSLAARGEHFQVADARDRRRFEWQALRRLPWRAWPARIGRVLFPPTAYMRQRYGVDSPWSLAAAYGRRMLDGLKLLLKG